MPKVNYRRLRNWKPRIKLPPNKIIDPATVYNRRKEKRKVEKEIKKFFRE